MSGTGFTGGAQAGYDWQFNSTVVGIEADLDAFHARASRTGIGTPPLLGAQATITNSVAADWLFTARGRLGWAFSNNILAYATGGLAVTRLNASNSYSDVSAGILSGTGAGTWNAAATKTGWTVGGGLEWALTKNWSARAEYLYVHFNPVTASGVVTGTTGVFAGGYGSAISTSTDLSAQIARAGINYKF
jgi:outer membrane immunogenic protein